MAQHSADVLGQLSQIVPAEVLARVQARDAGSQPAPAALSASVVLLRESSTGLQTYLLHRHARMPFAASMAVFPGGRMDEIDRVCDDPLRACALRETWEETGVSLDAAALLPWAHWITPEFEPRRFDTFFYLAELPPDQEARDISGETDSAEWLEPAAALEAARAGVIGLMPPTISILLELASADSVADSLAELRSQAAGRTIVTVLPRLERQADGWRVGYSIRDEKGV